MWTYEYREKGGYDCMTGAFVVIDTLAATDADKIVCRIDLADYGQGPCGPIPGAGFRQALTNAKRIVSLGGYKP